ncbi:hypothetical protein HY768_09560 [candidate division TA06 bacterium]|uniref:Tetratricopeptide repeat protein n=1 Tax=candidate division TA06 bacterium TaxID=2250710 RepID=A0A933MKX4_UNCT6|nr:hypothetical protein [candidate division TA06 bacterium]
MKTVISILCLILGWCQISLAQVGINVWPPVVDIQVLPGESKTGTIQAQNLGAGAVQCVAQALDCLTDLDGETILEGDDPSFAASRPCAKWVKINPEEFSLIQGGSQMVRYTVSVPAEVNGGYRLALVVNTKPQKVTGTGTAISARLVCLVNIRAVGTGTKKGEINKIEFLNQGGKNFIGVTFRNAGTALVRPTGILEVKNKDSSATLATSGLTVSKLDINSEKYAALPGMERRYKVNADHLNSGQYLLTATMDYGGPELTAAEVEAHLKPAPAPVWSGVVQPGSKVTSPLATSAPDGSAPLTTSRNRRPAVLKAGPEQVKAWHQEASRLDTAEQYGKALALWQKIVQADPGNASARKNLERTKSKLAAMKKAKRR